MSRRIRSAGMVGKGSSVDWCSPPAFVRLLPRFGFVALDPFSNPNAIVGAALELYGPHAGCRRSAWLEANFPRVGVVDDGLAFDWTAFVSAVRSRSEGDAFAYVNPPWGEEIGEYTSKINLEGNRGTEIVALLPSRTDTAWMHRDVFAGAGSCIFVGKNPDDHARPGRRSRIEFYLPGRPSSGSNVPNVVAYWGRRHAAFVDVFGHLGRFVPLASDLAHAVSTELQRNRRAPAEPPCAVTRGAEPGGTGATRPATGCTSA